MPDIQYLGRAAVRIRGREGVVLTDPFPRSDSYDIGKPLAHIVSLSSNDPARTFVEAVKPAGERERVFVIDGPGEYEVGGIMVNGIRTYRDDARGAERGRNTIYVFHLDDLTFCHLGELGHDLTTQQIEEIGTIDVLFVPTYTALTPAKLTEVISAIEPRMVVPLYDDPGQLDRFVHELGLKDWEAQEKLVVTSSSLPAEGEETRVVIMQPTARAAAVR
jgi:L-ascorbate metabolism protein UlaG (beta-lactamase superfamily)